MTNDDITSSAVVLRREYLAAGYTDRHLLARLKAGELVRIRHGAYVESSLWHRLDALDRHRLLLRAVLKTAHPSTVATHLSAAVERRAPVWGVSLDVVHVNRTDGVPGRTEAGVNHHSGMLPPTDVEMLNGIPVSRAPRCAVEVTSVTTLEQGLVTVNGLLHSQELTREEFAEAVERHRHWPDTLASRLVVQLCDPRIESVGESRTAYLCWAQHLPRPETQVEVFDEHDRLVGIVDFLWRRPGVFLEFDGREKYLKHRRPGESLEDFLMREKRRAEMICQLTGWVCIRITWADLQHPVRTAARIRAILASRELLLGA